MEPWRFAVLGLAALLAFLTYFSFREGLGYRRTAARQDRETRDFLSRAVRAPAVVVGIEERNEKLALGKYYRTYRDFCPVVRFQTSQGQGIQAQVEVGVERNPPAVGQQVEICYDSAQPQRVRLSGPGLYPPRIARRGFSGCMSLVYGTVCGLGALIAALVAVIAPG